MGTHTWLVSDWYGENTMDQNNPNTIISGWWVGAVAAKSNYRGIARLDFSGVIPADATITSAVMGVAVTAILDSPQLYTFWTERCTRYDWDKNYVCWNQYKQYSNWTAAGGDFDATVRDAQVGPAALGNYNWNVINNVNDARNNRASVLNIIQRLSSYVEAMWYKMTNCWLTVDWTVPSAGDIKEIIGVDWQTGVKKVAGVVEASCKKVAGVAAN